MKCKVFLSLAFVLLNAIPASAQNWAQKMFTGGVVHDFGKVPRGSQLFYQFKVTNIYAIRMEIVRLQSGCGCVTATASKRVLEPREETTIDVTMDARRFTGSKTVKIRVDFGPEYVSTAELRVMAVSRADIVFNPGHVNFLNVTKGQTPTQNIDVEYAGNLDWRITEIIVPKGFPFKIATKELYRRTGQAGYQLQVKIKPDAPIGTLKQAMLLKTNDPTSPSVPVLVEATVLRALVVSPEALALGPVPTGQPMLRRVVVRGNRPFRILSVEGADENVTLGAPPRETASPVQTLTLKCQPMKPGNFRYTVLIKTDLPEGEAPLVITGTAQ